MTIFCRFLRFYFTLFFILPDEFFLINSAEKLFTRAGVTGTELFCTERYKRSCLRLFYVRQTSEFSVLKVLFANQFEMYRPLAEADQIFC
jgi:hypothetical protein